jgi:class 3 adenylate cyclase
MQKIWLFLLISILSWQNVGAQCAQIDSLLRVLAIVQDNTQRINALNQVARLYLGEQEGRALFYAQQAWQLSMAAKYEKGIADALANIAHVHNHEKLNYEKASTEFDKALKIYQKLGLKEELATTYEEIGEMYYNRFYAERANYQKALENYLKAIKIRQAQDNKNKLVDDYDVVGELYSHLDNDKLAMEYFSKAVDMRAKYQMGVANDSRLLAKAKRVYQLQLRNQRLYTYISLFGVAILVLLGLILAIVLFVNRKRNRTLREQKEAIEKQNSQLITQKELIEEQKEIIEIEQRLSNSFNFMPPAVFEEIKEKGYATPHQYDKVSILFADLEHFTNISKNLETKQLLDELNACFNQFDEIIAKHHLIKLKTLGDSYMCAGGLPMANDTNPIEIILAALEMIAFIKEKRAEKASLGQPYWHLRVGINTGYVLAGVIGKNKIAYDVWGESVSLAKKMEERSNSDQITISLYTYQYVKDFFTFAPRVEMLVKPDKYIEEYVVSGILPELSENNAGLIPNQAFKEKMRAMMSV